MRNPLKPRKTPTQARAQETVDAILKATTHILSEEMGRELTTNDIAERAGVSIGSLYQYFPKKESILAALIERFLEHRLKLIEAKISEVNELDAETAIDHLIEVLIDLKVKSLKLERALLNQFSRSGDLEVIRRLDKSVIAALNQILVAREKELRPIDVDWTAFVLLQAVRGVLFATVSHRPQKVNDPALREELRKLIKSFLLVNSRG